MLSKIYERIIAHKLSNYLEAKGLLPNAQFGFRKKLGCADALLTISDRLQGFLDKGFEIWLVQLDLSAAFDRVNHTALLFKLQSVGIGGRLLDICREFLKHRRQRVVVDGVNGGWSEVKSGVPQGSVLGPLFFILYTSGMFDGLENELLAYADDSTLIAVIKKTQHRPQVLASINRDLRRINDWCVQWCMKLNPQKTKSMLVGRKSRTTLPLPGTVELSGSQISESPSLEILGVTFDNKLLFDAQIRSCVANVSQRFCLLRLSKKIYGEPEIIKRCFNAFVLPCLEYCSNVWGSACDSHLSLLDRLVRRASHLCPNVARHSLTHRRHVSNLCMLYKILENENHPLNPRLPSRWVPRRNTRLAANSHEYCRVELTHKTTQYSRTFVPKTIKIWNSLPCTVFTGGTLSCFKSRVNRFLLDNPPT